MPTNDTVAPAKGATAIDILINDHQTIKSLLDRLIVASDREERTECLQQLQGVLTVHNATEENLIYPALSSLGKRAPESLHLYHETANADIAAYEIDSMLKEGADNERIQAHCEKLRSAVFEHIHDEETKAFPRLKDAAGARQEASLNASVRTFRGSISFQPTRSS